MYLDLRSPQAIIVFVSFNYVHATKFPTSIARKKVSFKKIEINNWCKNMFVNCTQAHNNVMKKEKGNRFSSHIFTRKIHWWCYDHQWVSSIKAADVVSQHITSIGLSFGPQLQRKRFKMTSIKKINPFYKIKVECLNDGINSEAILTEYTIQKINCQSWKSSQKLLNSLKSNFQAKWATGSGYLVHFSYWVTVSESLEEL